MSLLVELKGLRIDTHERTLIHNVNVEIRPKRVTALCGPSGSGKSLTARAIMGVLDVDPGIQAGTLKYPMIDPHKDWFKGILKGGMSAQKELLEASRVLRGSYFTYSPQSASSALNPGRTIGRQLELAILRRENIPQDMGKEIALKLAEVDLRPSVASPL